MSHDRVKGIVEQVTDISNSHNGQQHVATMVNDTIISRLTQLMKLYKEQIHSSRDVYSDLYRDTRSSLSSTG